jgi:predicted PurR-regulated permease PerM
MVNSKSPYTVEKAIRIGFIALFIFTLFWLLKFLTSVLFPFIIALIIAYMLNPIVEFVQKKVKNRGAAVGITLFSLSLIIVLLGFLIIPMITKEFTNMGSLLKNMVTNTKVANNAAEKLPPDLWAAIKNYSNKPQVQKFFKTKSFWSTAPTVLAKMLPGIKGILSGLVSIIMAIVGLIIILLYLIFIMVDYPKIRKGWKKLIPKSHKKKVVDFVNDFIEAMNSYFRAQALVALIVGTLFSIGFMIIGLPLAILLGLFIGLLNMIPYLQIIGLIPALLLAVMHALDSGTGIWMVMGQTALVFAVVQIIQDAILVPKIMGKVTGMNPAMILLSLSIWGHILGALGLIIALPATCLILAYYENFLQKEKQDNTKKKKKKKEKKKMEPKEAT